MSDKTSLRQVLLAARGLIPAEQKIAADLNIAASVLALLESAPVACLGVYWPMRGEPDLADLYALLAGRGVQLALPVVDGAQAPLRFVSWAPGEPVIRDGLGVMVPVARADVLPQALLIPCVGFNAARVRIGYGGGFYDRTLALAPRPCAIGVAYAVTAAEFEGEAHDVPLDVVITERN